MQCDVLSRPNPTEEQEGRNWPSTAKAGGKRLSKRGRSYAVRDQTSVRYTAKPT